MPLLFIDGAAMIPAKKTKITIVCYIDDMELKVVSLNMWEGGLLLEKALKFIVDEDADVLLLQEVYDGKYTNLAAQFRTLDILLDRLKYKHHFYSPEFMDNRQEGRIPQGNAIFSKFPITKSSTTFLNRPFDDKYVALPANFPTISRNLQQVALATPAGTVTVFNFHGVWDLDGDNYSDDRKNMSAKIIDAVQGKENVILAGDTNAKPTNQAMRNIEQYLKSVFENSVPTTFNMRRKDNPGYATAAVDMMFVSKTFDIIESSVPNVDISDHLPLCVKLRMYNS